MAQNVMLQKNEKKKIKEWLRDGGRVSNVSIISAIWRTVPVHPPFSLHIARKHKRARTPAPPTPSLPPTPTCWLYKSPVSELRNKLQRPAEWTAKTDTKPRLLLAVKSDLKVFSK